MIIFSNCKINIGLNIVNKRNDGYHNLETIFFPLPLYDVLELLEADKTGLTHFGCPIPGNVSDNIVLKAYQLLKKDFPGLPPIHFYLLKNIPAGAGLGAGSANGATTLLALNKKYQLQLSNPQLIRYALQLGSDCPFFILNQPVFATGRGETMQPITIDLSGYRVLIVNPGIHIATPWAFQQLKPAQPGICLSELIQQPIKEWKNVVLNDFELPIFKAHPEIAHIKTKMYEAGAEFSLMSGSGSTVYGFFQKAGTQKLSFPGTYYQKWIGLNDDSLT